MIYEFFYLHDEVEWLNLKLHEEGEFVDKFVIIECEYDLLYREKSLAYGDNKEKFKEFSDKIIHIVVDNPSKDLRGRAAYCYKGFTDCKPDDIIIVVDPDVILKKSTFTKIKESNMENNETSLVCDWYEYFMDYKLSVEKFVCCSAFLYKNTVDSEWATVYRWKPVGTIIEDAGWHFSKIGDASTIMKHIDAYPHGTISYPNIMDKNEATEMIQERIEKMQSWEGGYPGKKIMDYVPYRPENYPEYVNEHPELYAKYFKGGMPLV
jgi:hypothetical protein